MVEKDSPNLEDLQRYAVYIFNCTTEEPIWKCTQHSHSTALCAAHTQTFWQHLNAVGMHRYVYISSQTWVKQKCMEWRVDHMDISLCSVTEMMVILILLDCYKLQWSSAELGNLEAYDLYGGWRLSRQHIKPRLNFHENRIIRTSLRFSLNRFQQLVTCMSPQDRHLLYVPTTSRMQPYTNVPSKNLYQQ